MLRLAHARSETMVGFMKIKKKVRMMRGKFVSTKVTLYETFSH